MSLSRRIRRALGALALLLCAARSPAAPPATLDVNTATQAQLEQLRGVGVSMSERLLAERARQPFADWADLVARVPGLGAKSAARLSDAGLRVGGREYGDAATGR